MSLRPVGGVRQKSKGERFEQLEREVANSVMATRMSQMIVQQLMNTQRNLQEDLSKALGMMNDMQYRLLAFQSLASIDAKALRTKADELRLVDYNEASDKEDAEKGYTVADVVEADSIVVISSTTPDETEDKGIFRSKFKLSECGSKDLETYLLGKKVGEDMTTVLNDVRHVIKVLAIRKEPLAEVTTGNATVEPVVVAAPQA